MALLDELKRRNVLRIAGLYLVAAWLVVQVSSTLLPMFDAPVWLPRSIVILLAAGFVPALIFAWIFELTPEGLKRERDVDRAESMTPHTGKRLDRLIMAALALALGYFAFDKFALSPRREAALQRQKTVEVDAARMEGRSEALVDSYGDKSIAVLPFVDISPNKDQQYFSDGIAEELLNLLARIPQLRVISRSSAFSFKGKDVEIREIAKRLSVAHVLEGSVRKAGDRVRISVQLVDARSDTQLWSETFDRPLDDIFAVQDEIAAAVVSQLKLKLLRQAPKAKVVDSSAYALHLQARALAQQRTPEGYERSIALYQQALAIDASDAAAWDGLASVYVYQVGDALRPIEQGYRLAREAVDKALAIDPEFAPAYGRLSRIELEFDGNVAAAARDLEHALALDPTNTDIIRQAAYLARSLGRLDRAIALGEYVVARDPVNAMGHATLGYTYVLADRPDAALASARTALGLSPGYAGAQYGIGESLLLKGDPVGALAAIQEEPNEVWRMIGLPMAWHALGRQSESDAALAQLMQKFGTEAAFNIAYVLAFRGEADRAFEWLDKAVTYRDPGVVDVAVQPWLANIHQDPRWLPFLRKVGKAPEQLASIKFEVTPPQ